MKKTIIYLLLILGIVLFAKLTNGQTLSPVKYEEKRDTLDVWIDKLVQVESGGRADIKILDSNNRYSYGCLQFQMETFRRNVRHFGLILNAEDGELENWIYDCPFQKALAKMMILEDPRAISNWQNSLPKIKIGRAHV